MENTLEKLTAPSVRFRVKASPSKINVTLPSVNALPNSSVTFTLITIGL